MKFIVLTLFPEMFVGPFDQSIIKRANDKGLVEIEFVNIRDFATDKHKSVDDRPYGGGKGMIMKVDVVDRALRAVKAPPSARPIPIVKQLSILLDPRGSPYKQATAKQLTTYDQIILLCGHYEGIDERIRSLVDKTISIGDYVVSGGEIPAMMIIDSVSRLVKGVLPSDEVTEKESFTTNLLEYPQYTRPWEYNGMQVPPILLSGNPMTIAAWQKDQSQTITEKVRPDLPSPKKSQ